MYVIHIDRPIVEADLAWVDGRAELIDGQDETLGRADAAIVGIGHRWDEHRFAKFPSLRVLSRAGVGFDNVDVGAARRAGVVVCNAPDSPTVSTAEHALALMLAVTKELKPSQARSGLGLSGLPGPATSLELDGATLGLVGLGRIACRVARAASALGMRVVSHDPFLSESPIQSVSLVGLDQIWEGSQVVSLHAPANDQTYHMVNDVTLAKMCPGSYLINCARGSLVDHEALLRALDSRQIAGVGLDVTEPEPLPPGHPLLGRSDVVITPHIASSTAAGRRRLFEHSFENALAVLQNRPATVVTE